MIERYKLIPDMEYDDEEDELIFDLCIPAEMILDVSKQEQKRVIKYINWFLSTKFENNIRIEIYENEDRRYQLDTTRLDPTFKMNGIKYYNHVMYEDDGIHLYVYRRDPIKGKEIGIIKIEDYEESSKERSQENEIR